MPSETPEPLLSALELADQAFAAGDLETALGGYRSYLDAHGAWEAADRALYRLAVLHLTNGGPAPAPANSLLRRLVREHPESPYRAEAELLLALTARVDGLETEIERLERQLEALKRIDLDRSHDRHSP
ncbi:MAG TPA: hypothetical protein VMS86_13380 [Thermoanaerobaculia bacterium]|nr:hypothetical protein [Thermoanaerobaculia bacterium]